MQCEHLPPASADSTSPPQTTVPRSYELEEMPSPASCFCWGIFVTTTGKAKMLHMAYVHVHTPHAAWKGTYTYVIIQSQQLVFGHKPCLCNTENY